MLLAFDPRRRVVRNVPTSDGLPEDRARASDRC